MKLKAIREITGEILVRTGLHIGGRSEKIEIGGIDSTVIKHPVTNEPYIPGSSLKGKMRSALEKKYGKFSNNGKEPCDCAEPDCPICPIFGPHKNPNHGLGPTRILVRDAFLTEETRNQAKKLMEEKGQHLLEIKTENIINRKTGTAEHPRDLERVVPGTRFQLNITLQILESDDEEKMKKRVAEALKLVEQTYLGAGGSRGSGKIEFKDLKYDGQPFDIHKEGA